MSTPVRQHVVSAYQRNLATHELRLAYRSRQRRAS